MNGFCMDELDRLVAELGAMKCLRGIVLTSAKPTFFAGGDLDLMRNVRPGQEELLFRHYERLKKSFRQLERLGPPLAAAINGTALGGGYELCLACHRRFGLRRPDAVLGLPEVQFGILPGAGGVVRLVHLIGLPAALDLLLTGRKVGMEAALAAGLVDVLLDTPEALLAACRNWILSDPSTTQPWDRSTRRRDARAQIAVLSELPTETTALLEPGNLATHTIARVAADSLTTDLEEAFRNETRGLVALLLTDRARELTASFFARSSRPAISSSTPNTEADRGGT